jgi:hypothetical protein
VDPTLDEFDDAGVEVEVVPLQDELRGSVREDANALGVNLAGPRRSSDRRTRSTRPVQSARVPNTG